MKDKREAAKKMIQFNRRRVIYLFAFVALIMVLNIGFSPDGSSRQMLVAAEKKTDILFLKGKFIMKDKKGAIVISTDEKKCHCPHYYR